MFLFINYLTFISNAYVRVYKCKITQSNRCTCKIQTKSGPFPKCTHTYLDFSSQTGPKRRFKAVPKGSRDQGRVEVTATNRSPGNTSIAGLKTPQKCPPHLQELMGTPYSRTERIDNFQEDTKGPLKHSSSRVVLVPRGPYGDQVEEGTTDTVLIQCGDLERSNRVSDRRPTQGPRVSFDTSGNYDTKPKGNQRDTGLVPRNPSRAVAVPGKVLRVVKGLLTPQNQH